MSQSALGFTPVTTTGTPSVFNFNTHAVRVIVRDGEPWFVASDVAESLGYRNAPDAARNLGDHQKGTQIVRTPGGDQRVTIINESGLYRLVLRSRKPEAEKFSDWVTGEVLPSIRKTGGYQTEQSSALDITATAAMKAAREAAVKYFEDFRAGKQASLDIPQEVLTGIIAAALQRVRLLVSFSSEGRMTFLPVDADAYVMTPKRFARSIATGDALLGTDELVDLAAACNQRLVHRLGDPAIVLAV